MNNVTICEGIYIDNPLRITEPYLISPIFLNTSKLWSFVIIMYVSLYIILVFIHTVCLLFHKHYFNGNWRKVIVFIITIIIGVSSWRDPFYSYVFLNYNVMWCGRCIFDFLNGLDSVLGDQNFILYSKTACILVISGRGHKTVEILLESTRRLPFFSSKTTGLLSRKFLVQRFKNHYRIPIILSWMKTILNCFRQTPTTVNSHDCISFTPPKTVTTWKRANM